MKFKESALAHKYLDGLKGIEVGAAAHNPFGLDTINVDIYEHIDDNYAKEQLKICGEIVKVDVIAPGNKLPFEDKSFDFVISSHVIEHFYDPIGALLEWKRVARKYIFIICPHRDRTFDKDKELTTLLEVIERHEKPLENYEDKHWTIWNTNTFKMFVMNMNFIYKNFTLVDWQDVDDKVGNGFTIVISVE